MEAGRNREYNRSFQTSPYAGRDRRNKPNGSNVNEMERILSAFGGGALAVFGLKKGGPSGLGLAILGGGLAWRGVSGTCKVYQALGIDTNGRKNQKSGVQQGQGIKVEKSVTINKPREELYKYWRNLENLPRFMDHLESVRVMDNKVSHWIAKGPLGTTVEWDAEIINEKENELIAWRSIEGATVANAGSVRFENKAGVNGTIVKVSLSYDPPGGVIGATFAKLFGEEPNQQVEEDLRRFKQVMETGETASVQGQPSGRSATSSR